MQNPKLLVLDLDETLIYTANSPLLNGKLKSHRGHYYLYERPHLKSFLDSILSEYDLAIWSASKAKYVKWVIKSTVLCRYEYLFVNTRRNCKRILGKNGLVEYQKHLIPYLSQYEKVTMLDDLPKMVIPIDCMSRTNHESTSIWNYFISTALLIVSCPADL